MGFILHDYQTTLKSRVTLSGIGVHSGKEVSIHFLPADADTGVVFHMMEGAEPGKEVRALVSEVGATDLCTMLGDPAGQHIATVEHLMAAVFGLGIDNLLIEIDGNEVPILDGSATPFVEAFDEQFAGAVHRDFRDALIRKKRLQPLQCFVEERKLLHL